MIAVAVDGPVGEDDIGVFGGEQASERFVVCGIDDGAAVVLAGEGGAGLQSLAGLLGFGGADGGTAIEGEVPQ